jgi:hypothetical protein
MVKFKSYFERRYPRIERIIAIVALVNLGLVFFDFTYLNLRQFYKHHLPGITHLYDPVKGIDVHPLTEAYQVQVEQLKDQLAQAGGRSPQVEASLSELRTLSQQLITDRAFVSPNGDYTLATVQRALQEQTGQPLPNGAFNQFWSATYLEQRGWQQELEFWDTWIQPFFQANYYRRVTPLGAPIDYFWLIDLPFVLIFATDIILRILSKRHRHPDLSWTNAILRRWYDLFLLLPFWRWLRLISVSLRLYQVDLLDLEPIRAEAQRDIIVTVGTDLAGIVGIEIIDQMQDSIRQGELMNWVAATTSPDQDGPIEIDAQGEVMAIANHLYDVSINRVLPRLRPDIAELVQHSLTRTLEQMPGYPQLYHVPGLGQMSTQVVQQLTNSVVQGLYHSISGSLMDEEGLEITERLQRNLREAIVEEFNQHNASKEIQARLLDVLEQFKFKYVKALAEAGGEDLAERTDLLHRQIR